MLTTSVPFPSNIESTSSFSFLFVNSVNKIKTFPILSIPLLPALPHICKYSLELKISLEVSLNLYKSVKTTVLVGIFNPILKDVVANKILIKPLEYKISIVSFIIGNNPA